MLEKDLWIKGYQYVGGVDEAGRGPLAGPLVSCCVIFSPGCIPSGLTDSKLLRPSERNHYYWRIVQLCFYFFVFDERIVDYSVYFCFSLFFKGNYFGKY